MKSVTRIEKRDTILWNQAELLDACTKVHHSECIAKEYSCPSGKDVYLTHAKATKALRMRSNRERSKQVYKCHICGHFHLTSKDGEGRRKRKYSQNDVREYNQTTKQMLADEKIMQAVRRIKSHKPNYLGYWQSRYRDMRQRQGA